MIDAFKVMVVAELFLSVFLSCSEMTLHCRLFALNPFVIEAL